MDNPTPKRTTSRLLLDDHPVVILPSLAAAIGVNEAIIMQQTHYWLTKPEVGQERDGRKWVKITYDEWMDQLMWLGKDALIHAIANLKKIGLLIADQLSRSSFDRSAWYSIDYDALEALPLPSKEDGRAKKKESLRSSRVGKPDHRESSNPPVIIEESCISSESSLSETTESKTDSFAIAQESPRTASLSATPVTVATTDAIAAAYSPLVDEPVLPGECKDPQTPSSAAPLSPTWQPGDLVTWLHKMTPGDGYRLNTPALVLAVGDSCVKIAYMDDRTVQWAHVTSGVLEARSEPEAYEHRLRALLTHNGNGHSAPQAVIAPAPPTPPRPMLSPAPSGYRWTCTSEPTHSHIAHLAPDGNQRSRPLCKAVLGHVGSVAMDAEPCAKCLEVATKKKAEADKPKLIQPPTEVKDRICELCYGGSNLIPAEWKKLVRIWNEIGLPTLDRIEHFARWWTTCHWLGKDKGESPTIGQLKSEWSRAANWDGITRPLPLANGYRSNGNPDDNQAILDRSLAKMMREKAEKEKLQHGN